MLASFNEKGLFHFLHRTDHNQCLLCCFVYIQKVSKFQPCVPLSTGGLHNFRGNIHFICHLLLNQDKPHEYISRIIHQFLNKPSTISVSWTLISKQGRFCLNFENLRYYIVALIVRNRYFFSSCTPFELEYGSKQMDSFKQST